jgi:hypothetical protein
MNKIHDDSFVPTRIDPNSTEGLGRRKMGVGLKAFEHALQFAVAGGKVGGITRG